MMVGMNISDEQLGGIADRAITDADMDKDGVISFEELKRVSTSVKINVLYCCRLKDNFITFAAIFISVTVHLFIKT